MPDRTSEPPGDKREPLAPDWPLSRDEALLVMLQTLPRRAEELGEDERDSANATRLKWAVEEFAQVALEPWPDVPGRATLTADRRVDAWRCRQRLRIGDTVTVVDEIVIRFSAFWHRRSVPREMMRGGWMVLIPGELRVWTCPCVRVFATSAACSEHRCPLLPADDSAPTPERFTAEDRDDAARGTVRRMAMTSEQFKAEYPATYWRLNDEWKRRPRQVDVASELHISLSTFGRMLADEKDLTWPPARPPRRDDDDAR